VKQVESIHAQFNVSITDVWFPDPQGRSLRVVGGIAARVHVGEPAVQFSDGVHVDMTRYA
jgi:hypothetical protein